MILPSHWTLIPRGAFRSDGVLLEAEVDRDERDPRSPTAARWLVSVPPGPLEDTYPVLASGYNQWAGDAGESLIGAAEYADRHWPFIDVSADLDRVHALDRRSRGLTRRVHDAARRHRALVTERDSLLERVAHLEAPFRGSLAAEGVIEVVAGAAFRPGSDGPETYLIQRHPSAVRAWSERWCYPGGKIEPGETPEEAIIREWREEVAGAITVGPLLHVAIWCADHPVKGRIIYRVQTFLVELVSEPHVQPEGGQADCWLPADTATGRGDMLPSVRPATTAYLALQGFGALTG